MIDGNGENIEAVEIVGVGGCADRDSYDEFEARRRNALNAFGLSVVDMAHQADDDRRWIEERWVDDVLQFNGADADPDRPHHNITKPKTRTAAARLYDLLFQAGDKNFSIGIDPDTPPEEKERANAGAEIIEEKITTRLDESDYPTVGRSAIDWSCLLGVGVIKGPVKVKRDKRWYKQGQDERGNIVNVAVIQEDYVSAVEHVPTWDYFPDMSVADHKDCAYEFHRHYYTKMEMHDLAERDDFNTDAVIETIKKKETADVPWHVTQLVSENVPIDKSDRYLVWEGYIDADGDDVKALCEAFAGEEWIDISDDDYNPDVKLCVWVTDSGRVLKVSPALLSSGARPFSVFCYDRDDNCFMASPGVPRLMRPSAMAVTAEWQRVNDNSDLVVGPQYIVDPELVEPIPDAKTREKSWKMTANKGWRLRRPGADPRLAFTTVNIPNNLSAGMALMEKAREFADEETMIPQIAQGDQTANMTKTFQGMELLMNSANTLSRRIIMDWDDNITIPLITRFIEDLMEYRPEVGVYGRFIANARGTNALMLKETQARNAISLAQIAASNPNFSEVTDWIGLYKIVVRGLQTDPDVVMLTDDEMQAKAKQKQGQSPEELQAQLELQKIQAETQKIQVESQIAQQKLEMEKYLAELKVQDNREERELKKQIKAAELEAKGKIEEGKIVVGAKAKEHLMAQEYKAERSGGRQEVVI